MGGERAGEPDQNPVLRSHDRNQTHDLAVPRLHCELKVFILLNGSWNGASGDDGGTRCDLGLGPVAAAAPHLTGQLLILLHQLLILLVDSQNLADTIGCRLGLAGERGREREEFSSRTLETLGMTTQTVIHSAADGTRRHRDAV